MQIVQAQKIRQHAEGGQGFVGQRVQLVGLSAAKLNGAMGTVQNFVSETGRFVVKLDSEVNYFCDIKRKLELQMNAEKVRAIIGCSVFYRLNEKTCNH